MNRSLTACALLVACAAAACAPKPKESKVARDMRIVREENTPDRLFEKGRGFHAVGDLTRAEQYYAAALHEGYPEEKVLPLLLRVCVDASRFQVAIDYVEPILRKKPRDHRLRMVLASLYTAIGQPMRARQHYETAIGDAPNDATARYALAVLLRDELHDPVGADKHFREYLRLAPDGAHAEEARESLLKEVAPAAGPTSSGPTPLAPSAPSTPPTPPANKPIKLP